MTTGSFFLLSRFVISIISRELSNITHSNESPVELGGGHFGFAPSVLAAALEEHFLVESAPADCRFHADVQQ